MHEYYLALLFLSCCLGSARLCSRIPLAPWRSFAKDSWKRLARAAASTSHEQVGSRDEDRTLWLDQSSAGLVSEGLSWDVHNHGSSKVGEGA